MSVSGNNGNYGSIASALIDYKEHIDRDFDVLNAQYHSGDHRKKWSLGYHIYTIIVPQLEFHGIKAHYPHSTGCQLSMKKSIDFWW